MYLCITKHAYSFHKIRVFVSPHTHFRPSLRGCFHICGHDKSAPTAADRLPKHCERIAITLRTPTKLVANIPPGVGADSSRPYPCIIKNAYLRNPKCIFAYPKPCFHIIKYVHSFYCTHIFVCHFVGVYVYAGAINRSPTAANGLR